MVDYKVIGQVAVLGLNNPPVNAISAAVRDGIESGIQRANQNPSIKVILIYGKGSSYAAGADIKEFESKSKNTENLTRETFVESVERSRKPVVSAIHGNCLGGGFELALASHYRVANKNAKFGFPEVDLGILPGWEGTQRLPRLIGIKAALDIIPFGKRISAGQAMKLGAISKVVNGDILEEGLQFAKSVIGQPVEGHITSQREIGDKHIAESLVQDTLEKIHTKFPGLMAPVFCVKAIEAAYQLPFEEGIMEEARLSYLLFTSGQSKAMQYAFFAQRAATKWELSPSVNYRTVKGQPVHSAGVIGAGTMGSGIVITLLNAGIPTVLVEQNEQFLKNGVDRIEKLYAGSVKVGRMTPAAAKNTLSLLQLSLTYDDLSDVDVVIEAVYENMDLKKNIFRKLDSVCSKHTLLFSNTSSLDIDEIASVTRRPDKVMGTHFFVPAYYMRLLENIKGKLTSPETIATATNLGKRIGKVPVLVGNCNSFVGNRMMHPYIREAVFMLEEGALPQDIDDVIEDFGIPIGPNKVTDLAGIDIGVKVQKEQLKALGIEVNSSTRTVNGERFSYLNAMFVDMGRLGRKTGKGFFNYGKPGGKVAMVDDEVTDIIVNFSKKCGIRRRQIPKQEMYERCIYSLINEGFKILEEGFSDKPEDIDTIWLLGYGWPRQHGGPMFYASQIGLKRLYERIAYYHEIHPTVVHWRPSKLLQRLARLEAPLKTWASHAKSAAQSSRL